MFAGGQPAARLLLFIIFVHVQGTGKMWGLMVASQAAVVPAVGSASTSSPAGESRAMLPQAVRLPLERERTPLQRQPGGLMRYVCVIALEIYRSVVGCVQNSVGPLPAVSCVPTTERPRSICKPLDHGVICSARALLVQRQAWQDQINPGCSRHTSAGRLWASRPSCCL